MHSLLAYLPVRFVTPECGYYLPRVIIVSAYHLACYQQLVLDLFMKASLLFLLYTVLLSGCCTAIVPANIQATSMKPVAIDHVGSIEIYDERARSLLNDNVQVDVLAQGYKWTEGPVWVEQGQYLLFSDIPNNAVIKYSPKDGASHYLAPAGGTGLIFGDDTGGSNGLLINADGELVLMQHGDRRVVKMQAPLDAPLPVFKTLVSEYQGKRLNSPNDATYHSSGDLYFTDPPYGMSGQFTDARKQLPFQGVFRLTPAGDLSLLDDGLTAPNGVEFSVDEKTMYVAVSDSTAPAWYAYDVNTNGLVDNRRIFFDASPFDGKPGEQGKPDGMTMHSSGILFATGPGGVWLFDEEGIALAKIRTGQHTSNCELSGDEKYLYITADDFLMGIELK